jgi:D-alanine transaminase
MDALANVAGQIVPLTEVKISVLDRGFLFGDSVYEVLRVYQGRPWLVEEHWERLQRSLESVRITGVDLDDLHRRMLTTIAAGPFREATVYIQITRGVAPRSHPFPANATPTEMLWVSEFNDPYTQARKTGASVILQPDLRWERCDIKSTNLLANVMAMQAAKEAGCVEALLYLADGSLTEGTHSSLFGVKQGTLITAANGPSVLPGCTRRLLFRLASKLDVPVQERLLRREELPEIAELFLSGTTTEVLPVGRVDGKPIGDGTPGPVTRRLQEAYGEAVRAWLGCGVGG